MSLLYGMISDDNGGVCLKKNLHYYTYNSIITGCTCYDDINEINENISVGTYILPYENINPYFNINTGDTSICLTITPTQMNEWIDWYINSLVTTGYTGYSGSTIENRVVLSNGDYYRIEHLNTICSGDTEPRYAIFEHDTGDIWSYDNLTSFYYDKMDGCGNITGIRLVETRDINPYSQTYNEIIIIEKCQNETTPIVETIGVSPSGLFSGNTVSDGGYNITERGICYSLDRIPTINDNKITTTGELGNYTCQQTNIEPDTYYYYRAYAKNILGVSYGVQKIYKYNN